MMWSWFLDESHQTLVISILGFITAFLLTYYYFRLNHHINGVTNDSKSYDELIKSLLSQYSARFVAITKLIQEIRLRLELVERALEGRDSVPKSKVRLESIDHSSMLSNIEGDIGDTESNNYITKSYHEIGDRDNVGDIYDTNGIISMTGVVLKLLNDKPMNTTQIQSKVKKSREHTSRFMKKLFLQGLVSRDMNTKPFLYTLTDEGRKQLKVFHSDV
jgi:predicted transcriptional regulator